MISVLESIFRWPGRLLLFLLLPPLLGIAVVYLLVPHTYQSATSLWATQRYIIIGATGPESDLASTPAQTQATALAELLKSRAFALTIASETNLASTLSSSTHSSPQQLNDALYTEISQKVVVTPQGYNLYTITYSNHDPKVAQKVVQAVIQNFALQSQHFTKVEAQNLLIAYQTQLAQAQEAEQKAAATEAQYLQDHSDLTPADLLNDPTYGILHADTQQALAKVQNIQNTINTINQEVAEQGTGPQYLFQVLDTPKIPSQPNSRSKDFLIGGGIGLGVALLACALYILILVRRDRSIHAPLDLKEVTDFPVVMEVPLLSSKSPLLLESSYAERL